MSLTKENVLVIVPALNEQNSVESVIRNLKLNGFHVLLVSDGSTDNTALIGRNCGVEVLDLCINLGVGGALRAGFKFARRHNYQAVVQVDADGQHPPNEIISLIDAANELDAHMVIGSRFLSEISTMSITGFRRTAMSLLSLSATRATGVRITDSTSGFRIICEPLLEQFSANFANNYLGDTYESVIAAGRAGFAVREIPASLRPREYGDSSATTSAAVRFTLKGLVLAFLGLHKRLQFKNED